MKELSLPLDELAAIIVESGFSELSVTSAHALEVRHLPPIDRDPFDRLLVTQARHEGLTLVTRNPDGAALSYRDLVGLTRDQRMPGYRVGAPRERLRAAAIGCTLTIASRIPLDGGPE